MEGKIPEAETKIQVQPRPGAVHVEKPTPASPALPSPAHYWSPHSPAILISVIWQNENTSFLAYLCCCAFWLPLKNHSSCRNPALSILFLPLTQGLWSPAGLCDTPSIIHSSLQFYRENHLVVSCPNAHLLPPAPVQCHSASL